MQSNSGKIAEATRLKDEANKLVQDGEFKKACALYRRVFAYTNGLVTKSDGMAQYAESEQLLKDDEKKQVDSIKATTYSNLALCYLKLSEPEKALDACDRALVIDPQNVKCLFRKGSAYRQLKLWDQAKDSLVQALKRDPGNLSIQKELETLKEDYVKWNKEQKEKEKALFGGKLL